MQAASRMASTHYCAYVTNPRLNRSPTRAVVAGLPSDMQFDAVSQRWVGNEADDDMLAFDDALDGPDGGAAAGGAVAQSETQQVVKVVLPPVDRAALAAFQDDSDTDSTALPTRTEAAQVGSARAHAATARSVESVTLPPVLNVSVHNPASRSSSPTAAAASARSKPASDSPTNKSTGRGGSGDGRSAGARAAVAPYSPTAVPSSLKLARAVYSTPVAPVVINKRGGGTVNAAPNAGNSAGLLRGPALHRKSASGGGSAPIGNGTTLGNLLSVKQLYRVDGSSSSSSSSFPSSALPVASGVGGNISTTAGGAAVSLTATPSTASLPARTLTPNPSSTHFNLSAAEIQGLQLAAKAHEALLQPWVTAGMCCCCFLLLAAAWVIAFRGPVFSMNL